MLQIQSELNRIIIVMRIEILQEFTFLSFDLELFALISALGDYAEERCELWVRRLVQR